MASNKAMVRYLTMRLWPSSRIQIRMRPLLSFYCAGYCFVCNLLENIQCAVCTSVYGCREMSGRWDQFLSVLSWTNSTFVFTQTLTLLSPNSISVDSASDIAGSPYKASSDKLTRASSQAPCCQCHSFGTSQSLSNGNPITSQTICFWETFVIPSFPTNVCTVAMIW